MKKLANLVLAAALVVLPLSAFAMEAITENAMDDVTGQAGVTITFEGASSINATLDGLAWGDDNGYNAGGFGYGMAAHVRIDGTIGVNVNIASGSRLTIDVDAAGLRIGLPNPTITIDVPDSLRISAGLGATVADWGAAVTSDHVIGHVSFNNIAVSIVAPTALWIAPH